MRKLILIRNASTSVGRLKPVFTLSVKLQGTALCLLLFVLIFRSVNAIPVDLVLGRLKPVFTGSVKLQGTARCLLLSVLSFRSVNAILVALVPGPMRNVRMCYNHLNVALLPDLSSHATHIICMLHTLISYTFVRKKLLKKLRRQPSYALRHEIPTRSHVRRLSVSMPYPELGTCSSAFAGLLS